MEVFRISSEQYSHRLTSSGSENRWNKRGQFVIYTGWQRSLSSLELVVHRKSIIPSLNYKVMVIHFPDDDSLVKQIYLRDLPINWRTMSAYPVLQDIGSTWYNNQESLILKVPSAVIPWEHNYIFNFKHPDFISKISLVNTENYFWDGRLF